MNSDEFFEKEYENLNDAILQAIVASKEVQKILSQLKEQDFDHMAVLNLFLSLDELYEMISDKNNDSMFYKLEPMKTEQQKGEKDIERASSSGSWTNKIDGKLLTLNEILFDNYYQGKFNEEAWLKKARIRL